MLSSPSSLARTSSATSVSSCEDGGGSMYLDVNSSFTSIGSVESNTTLGDNHSPGSNGGNANAGLVPRRTRKRFSNVQLSMLESLFHQNSHPSREEREELAQRGDMEVKSVTIWFQNKRQMERKVALNNASGASNSTTHTSGHHHNHKDTHNYHRSRALSQPSIMSTSSRASSARPSLDSIASRAELMAPRTPKRSSRSYESTGAIYDNMPSSPPESPPMTLRTATSLSPYSRDFIEFGKMQRSRTLEWACAAARLHGAEKKDKSSSESRSRKHSERKDRRSRDHVHHHSKTDKERKGLERRHSCAAFPSLSHPSAVSGPVTATVLPTFVRRSSATGRLGMTDITSEFSDDRSRDDEEDDDDASTTADEATTPPGTLSGDDVRWRKDSSGRYIASNAASIQNFTSMERGTLPSPRSGCMDVDDDDMKAALLLCGLGRPMAGLRK